MNPADYAQSRQSLICAVLLEVLRWLSLAIPCLVGGLSCRRQFRYGNRRLSLPLGIECDSSPALLRQMSEGPP